MFKKIKNIFKKIIKSFLEIKGYKIIRKYYYDFESDGTIQKILKIAKINLDDLVVFDVGANIGQSVDRFRAYSKSARLYSFEPNPDAYLVLERKKISDKNLKTFNIGLGDQESTLDFFLQPDSGGSSFVPVNIEGEAFKLSNSKLAKKNHNKTTLKQNIESNVKLSLPVELLSNIAKKENIEIIHVLKIDTQGFEPEVLRGCQNKLNEILIIETEIIFSDAYEQVGAFYKIEEVIKDFGFVLWDIPYIGKFASDDIDKINFIDATYVNENLLKKMRSND